MRYRLAAVLGQRDLTSDGFLGTESRPASRITTLAGYFFQNRNCCSHPLKRLTKHLEVVSLSPERRFGNQLRGTVAFA